MCASSYAGSECSFGIGRRPAFVVDRPIPTQLLRELQSIIHTVQDDERAPARLRLLARCMLTAQGVTHERDPADSPP
jgi:hypothetical protein